MIRALVHQLFAKSRKPTRSQCEDLARKLILKYPFVKDDLGNGYVSCLCDGQSDLFCLCRGCGYEVVECLLMHGVFM